ncbi:MAG: type II CAAX endopeptidase family protein [Acidobacteriota bacterium]
MRWSSPFWNSGEKRLRAGFRIVLLLVFTLAASALAYSIVGPALRLESGTVRWIYLVLALLCLWLVSSVIDRRQVSALGLRPERAWRDLLTGAAVSFGVITSLVLAAFLAGKLGNDGPQGAPAAAAALGLGMAVSRFALSALYEEMLCRGSLLKNLLEGFSWMGERASGALAIVGSSALFALMHVGNPGGQLLGFINLFLLGCALAWITRRTGSLWPAVGAHLGWNVAMGPLYGFPVSGGRPDSALLELSVDAPSLWAGGSFGPEGGIAATAAVILVAVALGLMLGESRTADTGRPRTSSPAAPAASLADR